MSSKPTTIFSFHHKCYKSMRLFVFKQPTTILSFHHKCYRTRSTRVYVFKIHHNLQFSSQMLRKQIEKSLNPHHNLQFSPQMPQNKINEGLCIQNPSHLPFSPKCYRTKTIRVFVFKLHHNLQFTPEMIQTQIDESLCLQNPPQSSVFTTNATETDR